MLTSPLTEKRDVMVMITMNPPRAKPSFTKCLNMYFRICQVTFTIQGVGQNKHSADHAAGNT